MTILICGGGTAGHIYPGLALAAALRKQRSDIDVIFVGSDRGLENDVVPDSGYDLVTLPVRGFPRRPSLDQLKFFGGLASSLRGARRLIVDRRPVAVVGMGGFASFPPVIVAAFSGCPVVIHEQNAVVGLANRLLARRAKIVALTFPDESGRISGDRTRVIGNPVRAGLFSADRAGARAELGLEDRPVTILVFGGSRGARRLNQVVLDAYDMYRHAQNLQVIHVTGMMEHDRFRRRLEDVKRRHDTVAYRMFPYIEDMGAAYAAADLVVSRAGATTVAEITAVGLPSVLVPYPYATDDHQAANAGRLEAVGAARVIADEAFSPELFWQAVSAFAYRPDSLRDMAAAARELGRPGAADELAGLVLEAARMNVSEKDRAVDSDKASTA